MRISRKWNFLILYLIGKYEPIHFNELLRIINGITPKALSDSLKDLQELGLIKKHIINSSPPTTVYYLTDAGKELIKSIIPLFKWLAEYTNNRDCPIIGDLNDT
ncbi:MAG: helix-turn-helix domain-containing protein [Sulfolobaceae archaeon]|nr:helix-turn-helix domain-containing protein [Sulfolobaceae archaeon]